MLEKIPTYILACDALADDRGSFSSEILGQGGWSFG